MRSLVRGVDLYNNIGVGLSTLLVSITGQSENLSIVKQVTEWLYAFFLCISCSNEPQAVVASF